MWAQCQETVRSGLLNGHRSGLGGLGRGPTPARSRSSLPWDRVREALQRGRSRWSPATQRIGNQERPRPHRSTGVLETDRRTPKMRPVHAPLARRSRKTLPCLGGNDTVPHGEGAAPLPQNSTPKSGLSPRRGPSAYAARKGSSSGGDNNAQGRLACFPTTNHGLGEPATRAAHPKMPFGTPSFRAQGPTGKPRHFSTHPCALQAQTDPAIPQP